MQGRPLGSNLHAQLSAICLNSSFFVCCNEVICCDDEAIGMMCSFLFLGFFIDQKCHQLTFVNILNGLFFKIFAVVL